ncbi:uncharacterized protein C19orf47 [Ostrinia nubilalis]|uniref:uncharacterized protein C19orf47 n=1 Tax=Ostrinia nubilalis TaxID=29057 RepID=UPI00308220B0
MDSNLTGMWVSFFTTAGIPSDVAATYALTFTENRIQSDMLLDLNKEYLRDMGISRMGDVIAILRHAKQVHENTARDRVLSTTAPPKVPVAAVTGRSTVTQPSSPASRMLEHYTRNPQIPETSPTATAQKRKLVETKVAEMADSSTKKARMIRFNATVKSPQIKEGPAIKNTVFSRLGNSDTVKTATTNVPVKPIYSRLGSKPEMAAEEQVIPISKDALKYEGILKSPAPPVSKKTVTVTTSSKNNMRKIAIGRTMRADETPVSVKDKLNLPKSKSVKFSNHIEYKEIETVKKTNVAVKGGKQFTTFFNKPERRLSMPEGSNGVKARLGAKNPNNLTITRNVFNRLGV